MLAETIDELRREISAINARLNEPARAEPLPLPAGYSYIHGNILFKMNKFQEAETEYLKAVGADPHHLPAYNNLINLRYVAKDYERALRYIEEAERNGLALNPKLKEAILQLAHK
jgi:tetratricopeptide (TPR) repeat protein